jgi:hypothetical protein
MTLSSASTIGPAATAAPIADEAGRRGLHAFSCAVGSHRAGGMEGRLTLS